MDREEVKVSVIIPNYNGEKYVRDCLDSLFKQSFKDLEVVVVDNASTDHSFSIVENEFPAAILIRLTMNRGFSAAVNEGIKIANGEYVLLINNDTVADVELVRELYLALMAEPEAAMAAPKMLFLRAPQVINSAGLGYCITGTNHDIGFGIEDGPEYAHARWIFGPCGGAGMYKKEIFRQIGLFDEDFFMYYEDVDMSFRAQLAGYKCMYVPAARIYHAEGGGSSTLSRGKNFYFARNSFLVIAKNFPTSLLLKNSPVIFWEMSKRMMSPLLKGDPSALEGYFSAFTLLGKFLRKRREVQGTKKTPDAYIENLLKKNRLVRKQINVNGRPCKEQP